MANGKQKQAQAEPQDSVAQETVTEEQPSQEQLKSQLQQALAENDWKAVTKISRQIDQIAKQQEKVELDAKRQALVAVENLVKESIMRVITPLYDAGELDKADGIWLSWDFGEQVPTVRLTFRATRTPKAGGGGTGKKFDVSTDSLLEKYGGEIFDSETGQTFREAYNSNTDKNFRYGLRTKLLKKDGII